MAYSLVVNVFHRTLEYTGSEFEFARTIYKEAAVPGTDEVGGGAATDELIITNVREASPSKRADVVLITMSLPGHEYLFDIDE